jgi:MinD-like ATPase involved in chromosome partitioning or flagellar assembly
VRTLAELPQRSGEELREGALRSDDLEAFSRISAAVGRGSVLVTGTGEGVRALSTGLAGAIAAAGTRTALLECDFTAPTIAATFGLNPAPGLQEYIRLEAEATQLLQPLVLAGPGSAGALEPLVCVVAGSAGPEGVASIDSEHFRNAVGKLGSAYEVVVLHGPTLGDETGALPIAAAASDSVLACVNASLTAGRYGRRLAKLMKRLPARSAGVVAYG